MDVVVTVLTHVKTNGQSQNVKKIRRKGGAFHQRVSTQGRIVNGHVEFANQIVLINENTKSFEMIFRRILSFENDFEIHTTCIQKQ